MLRYLSRALLSAATLIPGLTAAQSQSTDLLPAETRLVSVPTAAVATEDYFTIATAQDLVVTLTDLKVPAPLSSATVVVTQAGSILGNATLVPPASTATISIPKAAGDFVLRVFGAPNASDSVGTFTACVAPKSDPSNCIQSASIAGNISIPSVAANPTVSTLSVSMVVKNAGSYTVSFTDDQFPAPLAVAPNLALFQGSVPVSLGIASGTALNLGAGTYTLLALAQADPTAKAGLYGIVIAGAGGTALSDTYAVGSLVSPAQPRNSASQNLTLKVSDFSFPSALASVSAAATFGGTKLGGAVPGSAATFAAPAGTLKVWSYAVAGSDAGTYEVDLASPGGVLLQSASGVSNGTSLAFAYLTPTLTAGSYQASATDFQFPANLQGLKFAVAQSDAIVANSAAAGSVNFTASAGAAVLLVNALTPTNGNGLFDVNVQTSGASPSLLFDKTQAVSVSNLFDTQTVNVGTAGDFDVTLTDLNFPAQFGDLALVLSSGGSILGKIFGGGTFPVTATPGQYQLTFIATPAAQQQYGLYAVEIVYSAPTVTLSASPTTLVAGQATTLSWTTKDATSCTANGGTWSGNPSTGSGTTSLAVAATTTYTLACTGPGGKTSKSVTVTATSNPASSSHGGGGAFDARFLVYLSFVALAGFRARASRRRG